MSENMPQVIETNQLELPQRDPGLVVSEAIKAANTLKEVLSKKSKPVMFNGEQYLEFEDWQTLGKFYSLVVRTRDAVPVDIDGVKGAKAVAEVLNLSTGQIIGQAESYCLRDEPNWRAKPWFQLASMAQTRAGSKSLRNVLSWVVVLAGLKPTPAEEISDIPEHASFKNAPEKKVVPPVSSAVQKIAEHFNTNVISEPQRKRLYAIWKSGGKTDEQVHDFIQDNYGLDSTKLITTDIYEEICTWAAAK